MFRQFARLPFRRCLHSQAGPSTLPFTRYTRSFYALGASAAVAGYIAWSWNADGRRILLDSESIPAPQKRSVSPKQSVAKSSDVPTLSTPHNEGPVPEPSPTSPKDDESFPETPEAPAEDEGTQEAAPGGAFNPETGEINWDCPCLGGMAHGPCGQQFRDAFSCFVYSEADPKGIDCVEKFRAMQDCFREHPDVYGDEIMDDDDDDGESTQRAEGDLPFTDNLSPATTEQPLTSASS